MILIGTIADDKFYCLIIIKDKGLYTTVNGLWILKDKFPNTNIGVLDILIKEEFKDFSIPSNKFKYSNIVKTNRVY